MVSSLVPFRQALNTQSQVTITRSIRNLIEKALDEEDEVLWDKVKPSLMATGVAGSAQFDHAFVAFSVYAHAPELHKFDGLTPVAIWHHVMAVLRQRGYKVERGYIVGHMSEDDVAVTDAVAESMTVDAA